MTRRKGIRPSGDFLEETFTHDGLNMLLTSTIGSHVRSTAYYPDGRGNIGWSNYEKEAGPCNNIKELYYITTPSGLVSIKIADLY